MRASVFEVFSSHPKQGLNIKGKDANTLNVPVGNGEKVQSRINHIFISCSISSNLQYLIPRDFSQSALLQRGFTKKAASLTTKFNHKICAGPKNDLRRHL